MESGDIGELESLMGNMNLSDHSDPQRGLRAFYAIKAMLDSFTAKLSEEGFQQTTYMDFNLYTELPGTYYVEIDLPIKLNLPNIKPVQGRDGLIYLKAPNISDLALMINGYIRSDYIKHYVIGKLDKILATTPNGWTLQFIHERHGHCQTIEAKSELSTVYMNMIPVFEFKGSQWPLATPPVAAGVRSQFPWFAVPWQSPVNPKNLTFTVYAPFWLTETLNQFPNSVQFLNLVMTHHAKRARDFPNLSLYMLKSFMFQHVINNGDVGLDQLISIMPELMLKLNNGMLESVLMGGHNMLECMSPGDLQQCIATFKDLRTEAPYDTNEYWIGLLDTFPTTAFWFSKYFALYSYAK